MIAFIALVLVIPQILLEGFALSMLWGWFVVPVFNLPTLSMAQALGISLIVGVATAHYGRSPKNDDERIQRMVSSFMLPLWALGLGWIIGLFI